MRCRRVVGCWRVVRCRMVVGYWRVVGIAGLWGVGGS